MRDKFRSRRILFRSLEQVKLAQSLIDHLPLDEENPLEVIIREQVKRRSIDHNAAYWAGPLRDIAEQAWVSGRRYTAEVWHEHFKREFLPEEYDSELTLEGYRKWDYTPKGERVLVGSTTMLTRKGFGEFVEQVTACGAELGVLFSAKETSFE